MAGGADLRSELESILGPEGVLPPERTADFAVDGIVPRAAAAPATAEEAAELLRYTQGAGLAVIPWGGGTLMHIGNLPRRYDIALSLSRLNRLLEHEPADLTVTCQAGITLRELQRHLAPAGQMLPLDPPCGPGATIGGLLAANASGPSRHAYGTARDFTLGLRVVTAEGRITRAGGRVVKNVAGYDLCKLYIGSLGTLGVIVEATFKVAPRPRAEETMALAFGSPSGACALAGELGRRGLSVAALQLLNPTAAAAAGLGSGASYVLLLRLAGSPQAVERSRQEIAALANGAHPLDLGDGAAAWEGAIALLSPAEGSLLCKISLLPTRLPALIEALQGVGEPPRLLAQPGVGLAYASWPAGGEAGALVERARSAALGLGGTLVVQACPPGLKKCIDVFGEPPPAFALMRRVKEQFDPRGILSPGRFLGRL